MAFLFPGDERGFEPALIEVLDDSAGVFNKIGDDTSRFILTSAAT